MSLNHSAQYYWFPFDQTCWGNADCGQYLRFKFLKVLVARRVLWLPRPESNICRWTPYPARLWTPPWEQNLPDCYWEPAHGSSLSTWVIYGIFHRLVPCSQILGNTRTTFLVMNPLDKCLSYLSRNVQTFTATSPSKQFIKVRGLAFSIREFCLSLLGPCSSS